MSAALTRIAALVRRGRRFLVTSHVNPDGDAVSSQLALRLILRRLGKEVTVVSAHPVPRVYRFLAGAETIHVGTPRRGLHGDALFVLDCGDARRASSLLAQRPAGAVVVNIDHHLSNPRFGDLNWVVPAASSTAELLCRLAARLAVVPDPPLAEALYTGILTDTGSFRHGSTTPAALAWAGRLVARGADPARIAGAVYESMEYTTLRVLGESLAGLRQSPDGQVAWVVLPRRQMARLSSPAETEEWVNYPRAVLTARVALAFKEAAPGQVRVSFRSKGAVDVSALAARWGGGGHRNAAGATVLGTLQGTVRAVVAAARRHLKAPAVGQGPGARKNARHTTASRATRR